MNAHKQKLNRLSLNVKGCYLKRSGGTSVSESRSVAIRVFFSGPGTVFSKIDTKNVQNPRKNYLLHKPNHFLTKPHDVGI